jgi:exopolysaccharide biosynthesis polyprenyl glycosylphosphotransferase
LLLFGDFIVGQIALVLSLYFWASGDQWLPFSWEFLSNRPPAWFFLLPFIWMILLVDLYEERHAASRKHTFRTVATAALFGLGLYLLLYFFYTTPKSLPRRGIAGFVLSASVLTLVWRWIYIRVFTATQFLRRVLLVGAGETGRTILQITKDIQPPPFYWVGIIDDDPEKIGTEIEGLMTFGGSSAMLEVVARERVTDIIVAISGEMQGSMFQALLDTQEKGVAITRMPVAYEELLGRVPVRHLEADWILRSFVDETRVSGFYELGKRIFDILIALVGLSAFLVAFPFIGLMILLDSGGPIFYTQTRCGRGAQLYRIIKFRTMSKNAEPNGRPQWAEENDKRATRVGRFLRKTHLDELPQFINVLRGDMSIVGPRAERPELIAWFQQHVPFYRARLLVKPGITGWAQINYGYAATIDETMTKMEYDLYYIKHRNLILDFVILIRTPSMIWGLHGR